MWLANLNIQTVISSKNWDERSGDSMVIMIWSDAVSSCKRQMKRPTSACSLHRKRNSRRNNRPVQKQRAEL